MRSLVLLVPLLVVACSSSSPGPTNTGNNNNGNNNNGNNPPPNNMPTGMQEFQDQVAHGQMVFADRCAKCHGAMGEGTAAAPRVVGLDQGALPIDPPEDRKIRMNRFVTVGDVADFVTVNMPLDAPGTLSMDDYFAVLAFDLHANGIDLMQKLTRDVANATTIPRASATSE